MDEDSGECEKYALQFREDLLALMEAKAAELAATDDMFLTRLKLQETCAQFRQLYGTHPMNLVRVVKGCLATETRLVQQADSVRTVLGGREGLNKVYKNLLKSGSNSH